ncbi:hypothetical protein M3Y98_00818200 [Aphelenchoides besseyi]|nr:hypothetical protein M3Y98_00818200 [Aphelenchoides besseyi]KAI6212193.1 hypothetical protein M3Y96_00514400 [Aphelenchoides besseyi]
MSARVLNAVRELHREELYSDLLFFVSLRLNEHLIDEDLKREEQVELYLMIGNAYQETECLQQSVMAYQRALELSQRLPPGSHPKFCTPTEIRFLIQKSYCMEKRFDEAIAVLSAIPKNEHSLKSRSALAKLLSARLRLTKSTKPSRELTEVLACHHYVVSKMPNAYFSQSELISFISTTPTAKDLIDNNSEDPASITSIYFKASRLVAELKPLQAIEVLKSHKQPNCRIIHELAQLYYTVGNTQAAIRELERLKSLNAYSAKGMDMLAALYAQRDKKSTTELESLVNYLNEFAAGTAETFIALGYLSRRLNRVKEAMLFSQRALLYGQGKAKAPAALLRSLLLLDQKRFDEADSNLKAILAYDCRNIAAFEFSLHSLLSQKSFENVKQLGEMCRHNMGLENPRANFLYAQSIFHLPTMRSECEKILRQCIENYSYINDAPRLLAKLNKKESKYDESADQSFTSSFDNLTSKFDKMQDLTADGSLMLNLSDSLESARYTSHSLNTVPALSTPEVSTLPIYSTMAPVAPRRGPNRERNRQEVLDLISTLNFSDPPMDFDFMPLNNRRTQHEDEDTNSLDAEIDVG